MIELKSLIKTEITTMYLTSDSKKFFDMDLALLHESELEEIRQQNRRWEQMKTNIAELVLEVLKKERWGIFFKNEPMQVLPVQDSATTLFKVNEVSHDQLVESIKNAMEQEVQERSNECQEHQAKKELPIDKKLSNGTQTMLEDTKE